MSENNDDLNSKEYPGMDVTYEWGRQAPEQLAREASSLDAKIMGIFASASIIISLIAIRWNTIKFEWITISLGISFICFIVILVMSCRALRAQEFAVTNNPRVLENVYWKLGASEAKIKYWRYTIEAFDKNLAAVQNKSITLQKIIPAFVVEVSALLVWLFLVSLPFIFC